MTTGIFGIKGNWPTVSPESVFNQMTRVTACKSIPQTPDDSKESSAAVQ